MDTFADLTTPRYQLPFEQLPRGFVPFPERVVEGIEKLQQKMGIRYSEEYLRKTLELSTLAYYYEDYPVAYKPAEGGIEVLAVGYEEMGPYWTVQNDGIRVVDA
jgi:hypothetical protein